MAFLSLKNISFSYGKENIIKDFSIEVEQGSFTTLLGSSGSGKTTLLRIIGGFLEPDSGTLSIDGKFMNGVLPNRRKIGFVFQDYALFPHMTVEQNLFYGLKNFHTAKEDRKKACGIVLKTAETLKINELLHRYPHELSGGQQQRVALGRVLVLEPNLLLMDEPLSSLDASLRLKVREELKEIQRNLQITTIYVTHDHEEALSLSDKIAILNEGRLVQTGSPREIYFEPKDSFTAEFVGPANFFDGYMCRPEWISISCRKTEKSNMKGIVVARDFLGAHERYKVRVDDRIFTVNQNSVLQEEINVGDTVSLDVLRKWKF